MALISDESAHILLTGPPASAKTMFLLSLQQRLKSCYFVDGGNSTKAGIIDYLLANQPSYLLIDEIDKMARQMKLIRWPAKIKLSC
jgi:DNA replicative helicase MCM subunit Mcm2 (Cdc46/Mcm family)